MLEIFLIGLLIFAMVLNVVSVMYLVLYVDFFNTFKMPSVAASVIGGVTYVAVLVLSIYLLSHLTQISFLTEDKIGNGNAPLMLLFLFLMQTIPVAITRLLQRKRVTN